MNYKYYKNEKYSPEYYFRRFNILEMYLPDSDSWVPLYEAKKSTYPLIEITKEEVDKYRFIKQLEK